jgi:hypothetical protein
MRFTARLVDESGQYLLHVVMSEVHMMGTKMTHGPAGVTIEAAGMPLKIE